MSRLGLKAGCLIAAIVIWFQVASTSTVEQTIGLPLHIVGLQDGATVAGSGLPREVLVRVRGSTLRLLSHRYLHRDAGEVRVDLAERRPGRTFTVPIERADVLTDLEVADIIEPDRLSIRIDGQLTRRVPVSLTTVGGLRAGYGHLARPVLTPDAVTVTGPARYFPDQLVVATAPLDLSQLDGIGSTTLHIVPPDVHLQLSEHEVRVIYGVGPLAERTIADVPVLALPDALGRVLAVSPALADVLVRGVADSLRVLDRRRLRVSLSTEGLAGGVHLLSPQVVAPEWAIVIGVDPARFQVIVGEGGAAAGNAGGDGD
jgi:YbbR domain-containing protein